MLGQAAGGYLRCAENYVGYYGSIAQSDSFPSSPAADMMIDARIRAPWEIFVNARGERYVREDHPSMSRRDRINDQQPGHRFWAEFDQRILDEASPLIPKWSRDQLIAAFNKHPMFSRGATLAELGIRAGIDPDTLQRSVEVYNQAIERQKPDPFERAHRPRALLRDPLADVDAQVICRSRREQEPAGHHQRGKGGAESLCGRRNARRSHRRKGAYEWRECHARSDVRAAAGAEDRQRLSTNAASPPNAQRVSNSVSS